MERSYGQSFESRRRLHPRLWDADYCLLKGLSETVGDFSSTYVGADQTIVDFGCGAKPYRTLFPESCRYIGVDACENPHAEIVIAPGESVPLADGSADIILSTQVVYLIPEFDAYLKECRRLLRPDGRLFITTHGVWTYHPASGGDYYRFTHDGLRHILKRSGFEIEEIRPIVGTLGTGLHLRQLVFNAWLKRCRLGLVANFMNFFTNLRIQFEEKITPHGTRMSSPVIYAAVAKVGGQQHE
jgi:SAM-dependent methyltransferase